MRKAIITVSVLVAAGCSSDSVEALNADDLLAVYMGNHDAYIELDRTLNRLHNQCLDGLGIKPEYWMDTVVPTDTDINSYLPYPQRLSVDEAKENGYRSMVPEHRWPADDGEVGDGGLVISGTAGDYTASWSEQVSVASRQLAYAVTDTPEAVREGIRSGRFSESVVAESGLDMEAAEEFWKRYPGSCKQAITETVFADDVAEWNAMVSVANVPAGDSHPGYVSLEKDWAECMWDKGYPDADGYYYVFILINEVDDGRMTVEEFEVVQQFTAIADAQCAVELNINELNMGYYDDALRSMVEDRATEFFGFADTAARFTSRAQDLLSSPWLAD